MQAAEQVWCYFRCGTRDIRVDQQAAMCVSAKLRSMIRENAAKQVSTLHMNIVSYAECVAFASLLNSIGDAGNEASEHSAPLRYLEAMPLLLKPLHLYECTGLWKTFICTFRQYPTVELVLALDGLKGVPISEWMGPRVERHCLEQLMAHGAPATVDRWSCQLSAHFLRIIAFDTAFVLRVHELGEARVYSCRVAPPADSRGRDSGDDHQLSLP
jgi:hypothetical protein